MPCKPYFRLSLFRLSLRRQSLTRVRSVCTGRWCWTGAWLHWPDLARSTHCSTACTGRGSRCQMYLGEKTSLVSWIYVNFQFASIYSCVCFTFLSYIYFLRVCTGKVNPTVLFCTFSISAKETSTQKPMSSNYPNIFPAKFFKNVFEIVKY